MQNIRCILLNWITIDRTCFETMNEYTTLFSVEPKYHLTLLRVSELFP